MKIIILITIIIISCELFVLFSLCLLLPFLFLDTISMYRTKYMHTYVYMNQLKACRYARVEDIPLVHNPWLPCVQPTS